MKAKTCKQCKVKFTTLNPLQQVCGLSCAVTYTLALKEKNNLSQALKSRKETKAKLEKLKTRSDYIKQAQIVFNTFIRNRDGNSSCISCGVEFGASVVGGAFDCGHYLSRGAKPHHRFNEHNAHAQCKKCNRYLSGNVANYRIGIIKKIGLHAVEKLEEDNEPKHWTIDDLKAIRDKYKKLTKDMQASKI